MLQRLIAAVLGVLGLASIGLGVASATAWRADDVLVATAPTASTSAGTLVITAPGVLELGGSDVTVSAQAAGGTKVVLAIGKEADVAGWVGTDPHTVISGLVDRQTLRVEQAEAEPAADPEVTETPADEAAADPTAEAVVAPDPDGSDLWVQQAAGEGSAELTWTPQPGRWTLLAAGVGEGAAAPTVVLSWPQTVTTPWLVPGVVVGGILLLIALALGARLWVRARRGEQADWHEVETGAIPLVVRAGLPPASGSGTSARSASARGTSASDAGSTGTGTGANGADEASPSDRADADALAADDAPTLILTRRQMREAAALAPRGSTRRRGPHSAGDSAPSVNRDTAAIPLATEATMVQTGPMPAPGTASAESASATQRINRVSGGPTSSASAVPPVAVPPAGESAGSGAAQAATASSTFSASSESGSGSGPTAAPSGATPRPASPANPPPRTGRKWFARRSTSAPDAVSVAGTAPGAAPAAAAGTSPATAGSAATTAAGTGAGTAAARRAAPASGTSPVAGPAAGAGARSVTGPPSPADAPSNRAPLAGTDGPSRSDGPSTRWTPTRPGPPASGAGVATPPSGSRADAWRRSWGIPEADATDQTDSTSPTGPTSATEGKPDEFGRPDSAPRSGKDA